MSPISLIAPFQSSLAQLRMSMEEASTSPPATTPEIDAERPILRAHRPPPPPPPLAQSDSSASNDSTSIATERTSLVLDETIIPPSETINDNRPSLLFEFTALFDCFDYQTVRSQILTRQITSNPFATVLWRIFLHCLPRNSSHWNQTIDASREDYNELVEIYLLDLQKIRDHNIGAEHLNHPLSQEENSLWNQYYVHEELKENIYQDVIRTCQEISFFRQKHILDLLLRILYIHSRHHGQSCPYRQGMHEILAVIIYSIHLESVVINEYPESNEMMKKLYDPEYLAHDAYAIYDKIMEHLQPFYDFKTNTTATRKSAHLTDNKQILFNRFNDVQVQLNDTVMRVNSIYERLKEYDGPLYEQLQDLNIEPTVYGIRWLRLLFGREIPFGSIPNLWTVIFCYDECFAFVDYFFLALLMEIGQLFKQHEISEYSFCLQYLMRPNNISDVESVIQKALTLEKLSKTRELQRLTSSQSGFNRSVTGGTSKPSSPIQTSSHNPLIDATRNSTSTNSFFTVLQSGRQNTQKASPEAEMNDYPGRETQQLFDYNLQIQKTCANLMNKFIDRIRTSVYSLDTPNEEVVLQLNGLEQIANVLEGTLTLDDDSLQALANYKQKAKPIENDGVDCI